MYRSLSAAYVLVLLALLVGGCGGSSSNAASASSTRSAQSREVGIAVDPQFIAQADAICKRELAQLGKRVLTQRKLTDATLGKLAQVTRYRVAIESQGVRDLSRLQPPTTFAAQWRQMLGYMQELALELDRLGRAAQAKDRKALKALVPSKIRLHAQLRAVAKRAGFTDCQQV